MAGFTSYLKQEVSSLAKQHKVTKSRAFLMWFGITQLELNDEAALEATSVEGANDKGIDLFYVDSETEKVVVVQGKYSEKGEWRPKITEADTLFGSLNWLSSPESLRRDGKPDLAATAEEYNEAVKQGYGVELWLVYTGPKCPNVEKHIAVYNQTRESLDARRSCRHCHIGLLETFAAEAEGNVRRLESERIAVVSGKYFEYASEFGQALVATVPASELVRLYKTYEDKLFERNVRLYLGAKKGSINAGIAETLKSVDKANF